MYMSWMGGYVIEDWVHSSQNEIKLKAWPVGVRSRFVLVPSAVVNTAYCRHYLTASRSHNCCRSW